MKPIDKLLDCQHVKRWTLVATTAESTVASHSFGVAMIALAIRDKMFNNNHFSNHEIAFYALMHDVDEAETGDMATPTKNAIRAKGVEPNTLFETQRMAPRPVPIVEKIIKLADLIDNYVFIYEHGAGARAWLAASEVKDRLDAAIDAAPDDMAVAARWVLDYILERRSETDAEEGKRIKENSKRLRSTAEFVGRSAARVVD